MGTRCKRRRRGSRRRTVVQKPRGTIHPRVQKVGPEHFGIVSVDCAKARSKWMLCDFYGNMLVPPSVVAHRRPDFEQAVGQLREATGKHGIKDVLVAVERTGRYHHPVKRALALSERPGRSSGWAAGGLRQPQAAGRHSHRGRQLDHVQPSLPKPGRPVEGRGQGSQTHPREDCLALLPDRVSRGGGAAGLPSSRHPGTQLHPGEVDGVSW